MHIYPPLVHPHRTPMRSDHEACRPRLGKEEELRTRCRASDGTGAPFTLATTPRFRASGTDLQVESERTAHAHGCAQRAGGTTQRRHEAAPELSPDPLKFRSQSGIAEEALRARRPAIWSTQSLQLLFLSTNPPPPPPPPPPLPFCSLAPPPAPEPAAPSPFAQEPRNVYATCPTAPASVACN